MTNFTNAWSVTYEGQPADNENVNLGASRIRSLKSDLRARMQVDHTWDDGLSTASNDGKHNQVTLRAQGTTPVLDPTFPTDAALYSHQQGGITELFYVNSAGSVVQLTSAGTINPAGNFTVGGTLTVNGASPSSFLGGVSFNNDPNFYLKFLGTGLLLPSGNALAFAVNTAIVYNAALTRLEVWVAGVLVTHFP